MNRRGPLSAEEKRFIEENSVNMPVEQIAEHLERNTNSVSAYIKKNKLFGYAKTDTEKQNVAAKQVLHGEKWWPEIKQQFTRPEVLYFEQIWQDLYNQFEGDILASEKLQIKKYITLEILKDSCIKKRREINKEVTDLDAELKREKKIDKDLRDHDYVRSLAEQLSNLRGVEPGLIKQYNDLCKEQNIVQKNLMASRDDRVKNIQDSNANWTNNVKMLEDPKVRLAIGKHIEIMRESLVQYEAKLKDSHKYIDDTFDSPILTSEE